MHLRILHRVVAGSVLIGSIVFGIFAAGLSAQDKSTTKPAAKAAADPSKPEFLRVHTVDGEPKSLQTAIATYTIEQGEFAGARIDLVGAVHIAHRTYFQELNRRFKEYDIVLYELVAEPGTQIVDGSKGTGSPVSFIQTQMKDMLGLQFQLEEIDYSAKNFVHADMSPVEFVDDMKKRGDSFLAMFSRLLGASIAMQSSPAYQEQNAKVNAALLSQNRKIALRRAFAETFESMETSLSGFADKSGKSSIVTERNRKAMEVLKEQLKAGKKKIAVFYGAAHLVDMDARLVQEFHAKRGAIDWLDAWELSE